EELEKLIHRCETALQRVAEVEPSEIWAEFHNLLGCLYSYRMKGVPSANLHKSEEHFQIAMNYHANHGNVLRATVIQQNIMLGRQGASRRTDEHFRIQDVESSKRSLEVAREHGNAKEVADAEVRHAGALARHEAGRTETLQE